MAIYGAFSSAMLGMMSQAHALDNISKNIANINTGGYKGTDTQFSTLLSRTLSNVSDNGGVRPMDKSTISQQGFMVSSDFATDIAISGKGFFLLNTAQDGSGETLYGRDGSFEMKTVNDITVAGIGGTDITIKDGYLSDKNGNFVQGWAYTNGTVTTSGTPQSLRVDQSAFLDQSQATTSGQLSLNLPASNAIGDSNNYEILVYDSNGTAQSITMNFEKTGVNTWNVSTTNKVTPVAQVDNFTIGGTVGEAGDIYRTTVNGNAVNYTTTGTETSLDEIRNGIIAAINADAQVSQTVTATAGTAGQVVLTAATAGEALTTSVAATQGLSSVKQIDTVTLSGTVEVGDEYSVNVNGTPVSYVAVGGNTIADIRNQLVTLVDALPGVSAAAGGAGEITITADTAGTAFTATAATPVEGANTDNSAVRSAATNNYAALNDNTVSAITTSVANVKNSTTGATTAMTFDGNGALVSPTSLNISLPTVAGGGTVTMALDLSDMTQFYGDFNVQSYSKDGYGVSDMKSFTFDSNGNVIGSFADNTYRKIYQVSLAVFGNPGALESANGNVFKATNDSGAATITTAGASGYATIVSNTRELSNVDLPDQFTRMMTTQTAYNAASTLFRTADEMLTVARDLKR